MRDQRRHWSRRKNYLVALKGGVCWLWDSGLLNGFVKHGGTHLGALVGGTAAPYVVE